MGARRGRPTVAIVLDGEERATLERWARRPKSSQALALRCRIVLAAAQGRTNNEIAAELRCHPATVSKWRRRFAVRRLDGLCDDPRPGPPRTIDDATVEEVIVLTLESAPVDATHWSTRSMAKAVGISPSSVHAIWGAFGLKPHLTEEFKLSPDPQFRAGRQGPRRRGAVPEPPRGRGGALRGRKDTDPGPGPHRADPAADARHAPAAHPRLPPPRHHQPVRSARHRLGQRHHVDDTTAPLRRVPEVLEPHRQRGPRAPRHPRRARQRLHPQDPCGQALARRAPPLQAPLHTHLQLLDEPRRALVLRAHHQTGSDAAPTPASNTSKTPSTPGSTTGTTTPNPSYGARPPTRYSTTSPHISNEFPKQDTSYTTSDCAGEVPIVVASDAPAQSDLYSSVTLAGVLGTDCVVLAGARGESMAADQLARLEAAGSGGFIVGGTAAVPDAKVSGFDLTRLAGTDRWHTARLVGAQALIAAGGTDTGTVEASAGAEDPTTDCTGDKPILVASDAAAQSDLYSAVTLAGVLGTDCIILTGPRDGPWPDDQMERATAALTGSALVGYIVGGEAAVPLEKFEGLNYSLTRLAGDDRWQTAQLVGGQARRFASTDDAEAQDEEAEDDGEDTITAEEFAAVSSGSNFSCALRAEGTVACWGGNNYGQLSVPSGEFIAISARAWHACGVRTDGTVECWGDDQLGQASPLSGEFTAVTSGGGHSCGLRTNGTAECWGDNSFGQSSPLSGSFTAVSAGLRHTCGVRSDGDVECWGDMSAGQLSEVVGNFTSVSAAVAGSGRQTCAVQSDEPNVVCWGHLYGEDVFGISPAEGTFTTVSTGGNHACTLGAGSIVCWGDNSVRQSSPFESARAVTGSAVIPQSGKYIAVSAGGQHTCGLVDDGRIQCWGDNSVGQSTPPTS